MAKMDATAAGMFMAVASLHELERVKAEENECEEQVTGDQCNWESGPVMLGSLYFFASCAHYSSTLRQQVAPFQCERVCVCVCQVTLLLFFIQP